MEIIGDIWFYGLVAWLFVFIIVWVLTVLKILWVNLRHYSRYESYLPEDDPRSLENWNIALGALLIGFVTGLIWPISISYGGYRGLSKLAFKLNKKERMMMTLKGDEDPEEEK